MPTTLQVRFGHEENFSRYLLESGQFEQLLARAGFAVAGEGALEVPVAKGHEGREGRLDIYQPTTAGVVIGEMQYGTSDSNHRNRFAGYAKSVASPAAIVWVAERFRDKDLQAVASSKVPVLCVTAKLSAANNIVLTAIGGARLSAQSLEKRVAKASADAWGWVESVEWKDAACREFLSGGMYAESYLYRLSRSDEEWMAATMTQYGVLSTLSNVSARRAEKICSCADYQQIKAFVLPSIAAARAECRALVDSKDVDEIVERARQELKRVEKCVEDRVFGVHVYERCLEGLRKDVEYLEQARLKAGI